MNKQSLQTIFLVIAVLVVSGLATVGYPWVRDQVTGGSTPAIETEDEMITIQLKDYLLGEELVKNQFLTEKLDGKQVHPMTLTAILTAVVVGGLLAVGGPLAFIYARLDDQTTAVKEDSDFQKGITNLNRQESAKIKELAKSNPPAPIPNHQMPRWSVVSIASLIIFFSLLLGYIFADTFSGETVHLGDLLVSSHLVYAGTMALLGLVVSVIFLRPRQFQVDDVAVDYTPMSWGVVWVVLSGLLFLVVGVGLMLAIRAAGGA